MPRSGSRKRVQTTTDADGEFTLEDVPPGDHTVQANADGYEPTSREVTVVEGEEAEEDFELEPADEPEVELQSPTREDAAVTPAGGDLEVSFTTNQPGYYELYLRASEAQDDWRPFEGDEAAGTAESGANAVTVTVPDDEELAGRFHDVRVVFAGQHPEYDPAEDAEERALVVGDDLVVNVDKSQVYSDLHAADHDADPGDTLQVHGVVAEEGTQLVSHGLTVDGLGDGVIDFQGDGGPIFLDGDDQTLTGLEFRDFDRALTSDDFRAAGDAPTVTDNRFVGGGTGVFLGGSNAATVTGNLFEAADLGVYTVDEQATIDGNEFTENETGVVLDAEGLAETVSGNVFHPDHRSYLCDEAGTHDLTSGGDLATGNDFEAHPPIAFEDCLQPSLDGSYVHNVDSFEAHRGLQEGIDAAAENDTLEAHGEFTGEQIDVHVDGLALVAADATLANLDVPGSEAIVTVTGDDVLLEGLTITDDVALGDQDTHPVAVQVDGDSVSVSGTTISRTVADDEDAAHPLVRVAGEGVTADGNSVSRGPIALRGADGDGVFDATLTGNDVTGTYAHGIYVIVGDDGLLGSPLGSSAGLVVVDNTVTDADLAEDGHQDIKVTLVPGELNGEEPDDGEDAADIIFRDNTGIDSVEIPEGERHPRHRPE